MGVLLFRRGTAGSVALGKLVNRMLINGQRLGRDCFVGGEGFGLENVVLRGLTPSC